MPTIGRTVHYGSRTGNYILPAIVNCTRDTIYQPGVDAGFVPPLSEALHVHLTVFSPGQGGKRVGAQDFIVKSKYPVSENVSGCYQEWDIAYDPHGGAGSWHWPERM